jgi:hypothetical protein
MRPYKKTSKKKVLAILFILIVIFAGTFSYYVPNAQAALLSSASVQFSNSIPSATGVTYTTTLTIPDTTPLECIQVKFATTTGMSTPATGMTSASGFTLTGGGLTQGSWTNYGSTNGTTEIYAASAQTPTATALTVTWTGVTNSSITNPSDIYAQITSYSTESSSGATCSGQVDQSNVMAEVLTSGVATSVSVDPSLSFLVANYGTAVNGSGDSGPATTSATTIPFGTVDAGAIGWGSQTLTTSTNASHGYNIYVRYSGQMTDTNADTYRNQVGTPASPNNFDGSTSQSSFAYTTDSTTVSMGSNKWAGLTATNAAVDTQSAAQNANAFHMEYKVETSNLQPPGTYTTTVIYTATPTY